MKLKSLININEKKESIATSPSTNITLHYDKGFKNVGENGTPELSFTISMSSTGGKEFFRGVGDSEEAEKLSEAIKLELRRALRKFDKRVQMIVDEYKLQTRQ
jgi:hypothetical protein